MKNYRFAIIGCGRIAGRHAEQIANHGKLVAVCDNVQEKADQFASRYNSLPYYCLADLISAKNDLDVVCICTPNNLHAEQSEMCMRAGLHVLCEKPMALKASDAASMLSASRETGKILYLVKSTRFNPPVQQLKKILEDNILGNVYNFQLSCFWNRPPEYYKDNWRGTLLQDGGTLFTQFSHYIDVVHWLLGDMKNCVTLSRNFNHNIEFEDSLTAVLEMKNNSIGTINCSINSFRKNMEVSLVIIAEKGTVKIGGEYLNILEYAEINNYQFPEQRAGNPANEYGNYRGSMSNHKEVYEDLLLTLKLEDYSSASGEASMKIIEIIEKIYASAISSN